MTWSIYDNEQVHFKYFGIKLISILGPALMHFAKGVRKKKNRKMGNSEGQEKKQERICKLF